MIEVGAGFRFDIAEGIEAEIGKFDVLEFLVDQYLEADAYNRRRAEAIARQVPSVLHGVRLSLGSASLPDAAYLDRVETVRERLSARHYSEHVAFSRMADGELDELIPIPLTEESLENLVRNIEFVQKHLGRPMLIENVPKILAYEESTIPEAEFLNRACAGTGAKLLLDVENAYADEANWGRSAGMFVSSLWSDHVAALHVSGGRWTAGVYIDDHANDMPDPVLDLLDRAWGALGGRMVIVERDGGYETVGALLSEMARVRQRARAFEARGSHVSAA